MGTRCTTAAADQRYNNKVGTRPPERPFERWPLETREIEVKIPQALSATRCGGHRQRGTLQRSGGRQAFEGETRIEQHQMIYALFREEMANQTIHALSLRTCMPGE